MIIVGNVNTAHIQQPIELLGKKSQGHRRSKQHYHQDLINTYKTDHPTTVDYIFLNFLWNTDQVEKKKTPKTNLDKYKRIELIKYVCSDYGESNWKSVRKTTGNSQNTWKLSNTLLNSYGSNNKSQGKLKSM